MRNFQLHMCTPLPPLRVTFGHYGVTFHNITSGQKAPLGHIRTPKGSSKGSRNLRSLPVAMVLVLLYYSKKKRTECTSGHAQNIFPVVTSLPVSFPSDHVTDVTSGHVTSGHVTSGSSTASLHRKCDLSCAHILLIQKTAFQPTFKN